jgi:hypothetical protein
VIVHSQLALALIYNVAVVFPVGMVISETFRYSFPPEGVSPPSSPPPPQDVSVRMANSKNRVFFIIYDVFSDKF